MDTISNDVVKYVLFSYFDYEQSRVAAAVCKKWRQYALQSDIHVPYTNYVLHCKAFNVFDKLYILDNRTDATPIHSCAYSRMHSLKIFNYLDVTPATHMPALKIITINNDIKNLLFLTDCRALTHIIFESSYIDGVSKIMTQMPNITELTLLNSIVVYDDLHEYFPNITKLYAVVEFNMRSFLLMKFTKLTHVSLLYPINVTKPQNLPDCVTHLTLVNAANVIIPPYVTTLHLSNDSQRSLPRSITHLFINKCYIDGHMFAPLNKLCKLSITNSHFVKITHIPHFTLKDMHAAGYSNEIL